MAVMCKCGHGERWHNKPAAEGGANWGPVGCYFVTDDLRPTVCGCTAWRVSQSAIRSAFSDIFEAGG